MEAPELQVIEFPGVFECINAFVTSEDGRTAYFHDPQADVVVMLDLVTGARKSLKWEDKEFKRRIWMCYTLFISTIDSERTLSILFYNKQRKNFCIVHFAIRGELLCKTQTAMLNTEPIRKQYLAYTVEKCESEMQVIFYERVKKSDDDSISTERPFVCCVFETKTKRVQTTRGTFPHGSWELPFLSRNKIWVLSISSTPHLLASQPFDGSNNQWDIKEILPLNDSYPAYRSMWCNTWTTSEAYFAVLEKVSVPDETASIKKRLNLFHLDLQTCSWIKLREQCDLPGKTQNISFRIASPSTAFIHCDLEPRDTALFRIKLPNSPSVSHQQLIDVMSETEESPDSCSDEDDDDSVSSINEKITPISDLTCVVCLDTFTDPRTLSCGHTFCWECLEKIRMIGKSEKICCPNCRNFTTVPTTGLPTNWSLIGAIEAINKVMAKNHKRITCSNCLERYPLDKMWTCLTCKTNRRDFDCSNDSHLKDIDNVMKNLARMSYCGDCSLYKHRNHEVEKLQELRKRARKYNSLKTQYTETAENIIDDIQKKVSEINTRLIDEILRSSLRAKLDDIYDMDGEGINHKMSRAETLLAKLKEIGENLASESEKSFKNVINRSILPPTTPSSNLIDDLLSLNIQSSPMQFPSTSKLNNNYDANLQRPMSLRSFDMCNSPPKSLAQLASSSVEEEMTSPSPAARLASSSSDSEAPPLPKTSPPMSYPSVVRRPTILSMTPMKSPSSVVIPTSPLHPTLTQALHYSENSHRTSRISEI